MALLESLILVLGSSLGIALAISPYILLLSINANAEAEKDTIRQGQQLRDWDHLTSAGGLFKFGFFSCTFDSGSSYPPTYTYRYLGIWYARSPEKPVWVANRENPVPDSSGVVTMDTDGVLRLTYRGGQVITNITSSNIQLASTNNNIDVTAAATLLDSGNLIVRQVYSNGSSSSLGPVLWQSFDYPTDILLPGMKLGINLKSSGQTWFLTSWLSEQVPARGAFKLGVELIDGSGSPQIQLVMWRRDHVYWTSGPCINGSFANASDLTQVTHEFEFNFVIKENEMYLSYLYKSDSTSPTLSLGLVGEITMANSRDLLSSYKIPFAACDQNEIMDAVCLKQDPSKCRNGSAQFVPTTGYFLPGPNIIDHSSWKSNNMSLGLSDCHALCWNNCSCLAYTSMFPNGTGCKFWENLWNFRTEGTEETIYLLTSTLEDAKGPPGEPIRKDPSPSKKGWERWWMWTLIAIMPALAMLLFFFLCHLKKRNPNWKQQTEERERIREKSLLALTSQTIPSNKYDSADKLNINTRKGQRLHLYSFHLIAAATDNFSSANKLGQGGFGPVYKGVLPAGQHVAVKRLSRTSGQGLVEFKNEITLIAELQHMNLVKLLGCCIQGEEKLLIYEYMPNKSLDSFLFDPTQFLDWKRRLNIIEGIAQGLLYLHKYSRMRVIHRDLKASNILLDDQMNPKISDFGLARIFAQDESEANTKRIVGTYGYMSPEYAMNEIFSVKSDVYSFGVLLLEIVSGKKNTSFFHLSGPLSLIEHAWDLWKKGISHELIDPLLDFSCPKTQLLRCIHVGLLCVQECAVDRPTMSDLIIMLTNETMCLPDPKQPAFHTGRSRNAATLPAENKSENCSVNRVTTSVLEAR